MRKEDPGERFPWKRLADEGLALAPYAGPPTLDLSYDDALRLLVAIGYEIAEVAPGRPGPAAAILAFQRRFCPQALGQGVSPLTKAAIREAAGRG
jgi:N-acetylmuramoyl-L-alanine amidase